MTVGTPARRASATGRTNAIVEWREHDAANTLRREPFDDLDLLFAIVFAQRAFQITSISVPCALSSAAALLLPA